MESGFRLDEGWFACINIDETVACDDYAWGDPRECLAVAGQPAAAGKYRRIDVPFGRIVELPQMGYLPASLDGHVAVYERLPEFSLEFAS